MGNTDIIVKKEKKLAIIWLHGLIAAFIGGLAGAFAGAVVAPESFNFNTGLKKMFELGILMGIVNAMMFLKQSPLPALPKEFLAEATETKYGDTGEVVSERKMTVTSDTPPNAKTIESVGGSVMENKENK